MKTVVIASLSLAVGLVVGSTWAAVLDYLEDTDGGWRDLRTGRADRGVR